MKPVPNFRVLLLTGLILACPSADAVDISAYPQLQKLIRTLQVKHGFARQELHKLFEQAEIQPRILEIINNPGEARPWPAYRELFVTVPHANRGKRFWHKHRAILARAQRTYGVDPTIIVAIIGIETQYGRNTGRFRTLDALTTLGLEYPRRGRFFRSELLNFILLTREQGMDPLAVRGSYAGAIGAAQFIPSSYRHYAVDFDGDGRVDLMHSPADAIGSVANYFRKHGWKRGEPVASAVRMKGDIYPWLNDLNMRPVLTVKQLRDYGITAPGLRRYDKLRAALISFKGGDETIYRLVNDNFFVITRYNNSFKYSLAVHELSEMIRERIQGGAV